MFMAAHHFADAPRLLAEARRVLQPRGAVVLREHGGGDKMYYDAIHAFYAVVAGDEESPEQFAKAYAHGYAQYRDRGGWVRLAADAGFVLEAETPPRGSFDAMYLSFAAAAAAALTAAPAASGPPEPRGSLR
jgi:ubiquinone/menaquinone biosynthesis C-methylase UbiE